MNFAPKMDTTPFKKKKGYYWIGGQSLLVALLLNISWKLLR